MTGIVNLLMMGRFGNQLFIYAFARAYCEKHGFELRNESWVGEKIFDLPKTNPIRERFSARRNEFNLVDGESGIELSGYFQSQAALIYTRAHVREWFRFRPEIKWHLDSVPVQPFPLAIPAHRRLGDYSGYGYPVVSAKSYVKAAEEFGFDPARLFFVTEENPLTLDFAKDFEFLPDFYRLAVASVKFRGNSSFSFWASALGSGDVYSPVIEGLQGGREHDVQFVRGNHPRLANHEFTTDLNMKEILTNPTSWNTQ